MLTARHKVKTMFTFIKMKPNFYLLLFFAFAFSFQGIAQNKSSKTDYNSLIQFSGVVLDQDSLTRIPFVAVMIKGTNRGTKSDYFGFFNLVVSPGDEIEFLSLVHKTRSYKVPDTLKQKYYYAIQVLTKDTIQLDEVTVFPWPSKDDFKRAFLALDLNETDMERADKNLGREEMTYLERTQPNSASENYQYFMQSIYTKVYSAGQQPSISLLNPVKWAQFIDSWRKGKYKTKKKQ